LDWLHRAFEMRDATVHLAFLPNDAKWDPLRAHPRFISLLDRCGFVSAEETSPRGDWKSGISGV
jgi:hypothetical protein